MLRELSRLPPGFLSLGLPNFKGELQIGGVCSRATVRTSGSVCFEMGSPVAHAVDYIQCRRHRAPEWRVHGLLCGFDVPVGQGAGAFESSRGAKTGKRSRRRMRA
jgi:hypothetical protein